MARTEKSPQSLPLAHSFTHFLDRWLPSLPPLSDPLQRSVSRWRRQRRTTPPHRLGQLNPISSGGPWYERNDRRGGRTHGSLDQSGLTDMHTTLSLPRSRGHYGASVAVSDVIVLLKYGPLTDQLANNANCLPIGRSQRERQKGWMEHGSCEGVWSSDPRIIKRDDRLELHRARVHVVQRRPLPVGQM